MKDFKRFKKKVLIEHAIVSAVIGIGVGLAGAAFAIVLCYLTNPKIVLLFALPVGLILAVSAGLLMWYKGKPSDIKIALRLDKKLGLNEKISTMIEFQEKEGALFSKQRDDAEERLATRPTNSLSFTLSLWVVPALALSMGLFAGSFFVPQNKNFIDSALESSQTIDGVTESAVESIKSEIEKADVDESFKQALESILDSLCSDLSGVTNVDSRQSMVNDAKDEVDSLVTDVNSTKIIGQCLMTEPDWYLYDLGEAIFVNDVQTARDVLQDMFNELAGLSGQELANRGHELAEQIRDALAKAEQAGVNPADDLYQTLKALADQLDSLGEKTTATTKTESAIASVAGEIDSALTAQDKRDSLAESVKKEMDDLVDPFMPSAPGDTTISSKADQTDTNGGDTAGDTKTSETETNNGASETEASDSDSGTGASETNTSMNTSGSDTSGGISGSDTGGIGSSDSNNHTETIYTESGQTEYGSVINSYQGGFVDDRRGDDDSETGGAADDYFGNLYGSGEGSGEGK